MTITRNQIYGILILISASIMFGRIIAVDRVDYKELQSYKWRQNNKLYKEKNERLKLRLERGEIKRESYVREMRKTHEALIKDAQYNTPILSGNDRSRWATIRALVEPDMRVKNTLINREGKEYEKTVWYAIDKVQMEKGFDTIDMVKHSLSEAPYSSHLYSSKPPLLPTVMAIPYAIIYHGSKFIYGEKKILVYDRNIDPDSEIIEEQNLANVPDSLGIKFEADGNRPAYMEPTTIMSLSDNDERYFIVRSMLILINLIPIVFCWVLLARLIDRFGASDWARIFCVGFMCFGTFLSTFIITLNNHIPAMICVTISGYAVVRIFFDGETRLRYFAIAGFFGTFAFACDLPAIIFGFLIGLLLLIRFPSKTLIGFVPMSIIVFAGFFATNEIAFQDIRPAYSNKEWYFFEYSRSPNPNAEKIQSYWHNPQGVDKGEESRAVYFVQATVGHHGLFSLTPIWLLSFAGLFVWLFNRGDVKLRIAALLILTISVVVISFYLLMMGQNQRSYGGVSSALRWLFWLIPLWLV
ncbi:MAG: hypothetical protein LBK06_09170, partial [Planctomycetaceae bacterium]|nr:hypothetical protein [Planctomycetaceae bacterium]